MTPYRGKQDLARQVAEVVARSAGRVFLTARLICEELIRTQHAADPRSDEWRNRLPNTIGSAFGAYLGRFGAEEQRVRDLLLPLAYAEGEGLPWYNLWARLAQALSGRPYTDSDVTWVRHKAGAYIIEALQSGQSVYRLYHKALADHLHDHLLCKKRQRRIAESADCIGAGWNFRWRQSMAGGGFVCAPTPQHACRVGWNTVRAHA